MIVGLIKNPETVNSTTRLVYFAFIMVGMLGQFGIFGEQLKDMLLVSLWYSANIISVSLNPEKWNAQTTEALFVTIGYAFVFSVSV